MVLFQPTSYVYILHLKVKFDLLAVKIVQIGYDRLSCKYLTALKMDAVNSAKIHASFVCFFLT